jgi:hypothetical protein
LRPWSLPYIALRPAADASKLIAVVPVRIQIADMREAPGSSAAGARR